MELRMETPPESTNPTGDPAHVAAMVAKAEAGTNVNGADPAGQELIAGKYTSEAELEKGILAALKKQHGDVNGLAAFYKTLESQLGKPEEVKPEVKPEENKPQKLEIKPQEQPQGIDIKALSDEFAKEGKLSDESYTALQAKGFTKETVDAFIAGQMALQEKTVQSLTADIGGMEGFNKLAQWASANLPAEEIQAFNKVMDSGDVAQSKLALAGLNFKYSQANGFAPNLVNGSAAPVGAGDVFSSLAQVKAAMGDPRYARDPAYQQAVIEKLGRSKL